MKNNYGNYLFYYFLAILDFNHILFNFEKYEDNWYH